MPADIQVEEDSGNYSEVNVTNIARGPTADEDDQNVTFSAVLVGGSAELFVPRRWICPGDNATEPSSVFGHVVLAVCPGGRIMFEVAPNSVGTAVFNKTKISFVFSLDSEQFRPPLMVLTQSAFDTCCYF